MHQKIETTTTFLSQGNLLRQTLVQSLKVGDKAAFLEAVKQTAVLMFRDEQGNTLLHFAVQAPKDALFFTNHLLESGAIPINSRNAAEETPLYGAVKQGDIGLVRLLMAYNANPYAEDSQGQTPLSLAMTQKQSAILSIFSGMTTIDMGLESLKLRENILNLTDPSTLVTEMLNHLPVWFEKLPLYYHTLLLELQKQLFDRSLILSCTKVNKPKKLKRDSAQEKEKKANKSAKAAKPKRSHTEKLAYRQRVTPVLEAVEALKRGLMAENPETHKAILHQLEQLYLYYQSPFEQDVVEKEENVQHFRLQSPSLGYRDISKPAAKRFARYFVNQNERAKEASYKINQYGLHDVIQMNQTHYKISPTAPGIEYAVHALGQLFTGQASAPTELLVIEQSRVDEDAQIQVQFLPVLASQTISGVLFRDLLEQQPSAVQRIEPYNFSLQCVLALLTCTVDGKPDNFMAKPQFDTQGQLMDYLLVGIDNDEAFGEPIFASGSTTKFHSLMLKTCLFCLPQLEQPVDRVLRKQLLEQHPARLVLRWLNLLRKYNEAFEARGVATHYLQGILREVELPLRLVPKTAVKLYQILCLVQTALRDQPELSHMQLLEICYPLVAVYYDFVRKKAQGDIIKAMELVYRGPLFEELSLTPVQMEILKEFTQRSSFYRDQRQQTILQATQEFCDVLDFGALNRDTQQAVLLQVMADFPALTSLTLNHCSVLDGVLLQEMSTYFTHLEQLVLRDCQSFNAQGMHALLQRFPNLRITIEGLKAFKPHDLLTVSRFCSHLYLILPDGSRHVVDRNNQFLLPAALKQNDLHLVTFLLLAGFHLTQEAEKYSPLYEAIQQKQAPLVQALLDYGSDPNQYIRQLSLLDKAYQLLQATPDTEPVAQAQCRAIIGILVEAGAIETRSAVPILAIGKTLWQQQSDFIDLADRWVHFALAHNQLNAALVNTLIPPDIKVVNWSRQVSSGYQLTDEVLQALLARMKSAKVLNLSGCQGVTRQHLQQCTRLSLQTLILDFQQGIETGLVVGSELSLTLQKAGVQVQIDAIQLNGAKIVQTQFTQLIHVLSQPQNQVKRLEMTNSILSSLQVQELAHALSCQSDLKWVHLRWMGLGQMTATGESHLALLMREWKSPNLIELCLDDNGLKMEHSTVLLRWLRDHPRLKELSLYRNPLGDTGIVELAPGLRSCRELTKLNLNQIGLTDVGFTNWLQKGIPPRLVFLDIGYNQLTAESVASILELVRLNESVSELRYAGQPGLEEAMPQRVLSGLLQQNAQWEQQRALLQPYQADFFQKKLPKRRVLTVPAVISSSPATSVAVQVPAPSASPNRITLQRKPKRRFMADKLFLSPLLQPLGGQSVVTDKETTLLITQLTTTVKEADEMDQMIDKPLSYQQSGKRDIDQTIEDNEREQTALERDIRQLQSNRQVSQTQISQLQIQLQTLVMQQEALWRQYERKMAQQEAVAAFDQHPALCLFYNTVHLKLEELFIGCKAVASHLIKTAPGTLTDVSKGLSVGIDLLGDTLSFIPGLRMIVGASTSILDKIDEKQASNQAKYIARLASVKVLLKVAEQTARYLTEAFQEQLKAIDEPSTVSTVPSPLKNLALKGMHALLKSHTKQVIQNVADVAVAVIFKALASQRIQEGTLSSLTQQLVFAVTHLSGVSDKSHHPFKVSLPQDIKKRFMEEVSTRQGNIWAIREVYRKPGIMTREGYYFTHASSDPSRYGYRYGSEAEAKKLGMQESQPVTNLFQMRTANALSVSLESPRVNTLAPLPSLDTQTTVVTSSSGPTLSRALPPLPLPPTRSRQSAVSTPFWSRGVPETETKPPVTGSEASEAVASETVSNALPNAPGKG